MALNLDTTATKMANLRAQINKLEDEKQGIIEWVEKKQKEYDEFEKKALKIRTELEKKHEEVHNKDEQLQKDLKRNAQLLSQIIEERKKLEQETALSQTASNELAKKNAEMGRKIEELKGKELEVDAKLRKWTEIKKIFEGIK